MKGKLPFVMTMKNKMKFDMANRPKLKKPITLETSKELKQKIQSETLGNLNKRLINIVEDSTDYLNLSRINISHTNMMRVSNSLGDLTEFKPENILRDRYQQANRTSFSFISDSNEEGTEFRGDLCDLNETPTTICNYYQPSEHTSEKKKREYIDARMNKINLNSMYQNMSVEKKQITQIGNIIPKGKIDNRQLQHNEPVIKVKRKKGLQTKNINNSIMSLSSLSSVVNDYCNETKRKEELMKQENSLAERSKSKSKGKPSRANANTTYSKTNNRSSSIIYNVNMNYSNKHNVITKEYVSNNYSNNSHINNKVNSTKKKVHKPLVLYFDKLKFEGHLMISPKNNNDKASSSQRKHQVNSNKSTIPSSSSAAKIKINQQQSKGEKRGGNDMKISKTVTEFTLHQKYISSLKIKEKMDQTPKADRLKSIQINKKASLTQQQIDNASSPILNSKNYTSSAKHQSNNQSLKTASLQQNKIRQSVFVMDDQQHMRVPLCVTSNKKNGYMNETTKNFKKSNTQSSIKRNGSSISMIDSNGPCSVKQKLLDKMNKVVNHNLLYEIHNAYKNQNCSTISPIFKSGKKNPMNSNKKDTFPQNYSKDNSNSNNSKRIIQKNINDIIVAPNKFCFSSNKKKNSGYYCLNSNLIQDEFFNC